MLSFRDVKASGLYFLIYSYCLSWMKKDNHERENTGHEIFVAGGLAGKDTNNHNDHH